MSKFTTFWPQSGTGLNLIWMIWRKMVWEERKKPNLMLLPKLGTKNIDKWRKSKTMFSRNGSKKLSNKTYLKTKLLKICVTSAKKKTLWKRDSFSWLTLPETTLFQPCSNPKSQTSTSTFAYIKFTKNVMKRFKITRGSAPCVNLTLTATFLKNLSLMSHIPKTGWETLKISSQTLILSQVKALTPTGQQFSWLI